jgi:hypothetical protein
MPREQSVPGGGGGREREKGKPSRVTSGLDNNGPRRRRHHVVNDGPYQNSTRIWDSQGGCKMAVLLGGDRKTQSRPEGQVVRVLQYQLT